MDRCPKCHRFGVVFNYWNDNLYSCLWKDCNWQNKEYKNPDVPIKFKKFINSIKKKCCNFGEFKCDIKIMPNVYVDVCIADIIKALNNAGIETVASCCGHNKIPGSIILKDGREILLVNSPEERDKLIKYYKEEL